MKRAIPLAALLLAGCVVDTAEDARRREDAEARLRQGERNAADLCLAYARWRAAQPARVAWMDDYCGFSTE
ncbi:MAG: hypothetical protein M5U08_13810 [Burkholderiales bacterium]|nr:hypothetical protein [Burkholderiales bacterium]